MKICLYQEGLEQMRRISKSGITAAFEHLKEALRSQGIQYTTNIQKGDFEILHINLGIGPLSKYYAEKWKAQGKRVIIHAHSTAEDFEGSFRLSRRLKPVLRKVLPFFYGSADLILCPSEYTKGVLKGYGLKNEIKVISNGVNVKKYRFSRKKRAGYRKREGIKNGTPLVFCVGHVFSKKGALDFARLAESMPQFHFRWFGTIYNPFFVDYGKLNRYLKNPPKNLKFTGFYEDIIEAYSAGDMFLFPSYDENQGIVILEAAAMGKPIIVRDIPAYKGWLVHGKNCLKARNNAEFKECIERVANDSKLRKRLVLGSRKLAQENELGNIGKKLKRIYLGLLAKKRIAKPRGISLPRQLELRLRRPILRLR